MHNCAGCRLECSANSTSSLAFKETVVRIMQAFCILGKYCIHEPKADNVEQRAETIQKPRVHIKDTKQKYRVCHDSCHS